MLKKGVDKRPLAQQWLPRKNQEEMDKGMQALEKGHTSNKRRCVSELAAEPIGVPNGDPKASGAGT